MKTSVYHELGVRLSFSPRVECGSRPATRVYLGVGVGGAITRLRTRIELG
jgi:hypothetical protein